MMEYDFDIVWGLRYILLYPIFFIWLLILFSYIYSYYKISKKFNKEELRKKYPMINTNNVDAMIKIANIFIKENNKRIKIFYIIFIPFFMIMAWMITKIPSSLPIVIFLILGVLTIYIVYYFNALKYKLILKKILELEYNDELPKS